MEIHIYISFIYIYMKKFFFKKLKMSKNSRFTTRK